MKIKVSKVFAKFICDTCKERGIKATAYVREFIGNNQLIIYDAMVGDAMDAFAYNDLSSRGNLQAVCIEWPAEYYACPVYLSTSKLMALLREHHVKTWDGLKDMVADICNI